MDSKEHTSGASPTARRNFPGFTKLSDLVEAQSGALTRTHRFVQSVAYMIENETLVQSEVNGRRVCIIDAANADALSFLSFEMDQACKEAAEIQEDIEAMVGKGNT